MSWRSGTHRLPSAPLQWDSFCSLYKYQFVFSLSARSLFAGSCWMPPPGWPARIQSVLKRSWHFPFKYGAPHSCLPCSLTLCFADSEDSPDSLRDSPHSYLLNRCLLNRAPQASVCSWAHMELLIYWITSSNWPPWVRGHHTGEWWLLCRVLGLAPGGRNTPKWTAFAKLHQWVCERTENNQKGDTPH